MSPLAALHGEAASAESRARARRNWFGYLAMICGNFMAVLDIQIVAASINQLQAGLAASADEIQWVQTSYLIAEVIAIPLSGYLSRMLSTRVYFVICSVGFSLSSLACAFAWNLPSMIVFRVAQGFLGGGMIPTTSAAIFMMFPAEKRVVPLILAGMMSTLAPSIGPTIGGYLTATLSWHWLFLINLVPGLVMSVLVWNLVRFDRALPEMFRQIDLRALAALAVFLGCFEYALDEGPRHDWFADDSIALAAVFAVLGGAVFFWRSFTAAHPLVDLRAFGNRNFAIGCGMGTLIGLGLYTLVYLTPLFLGQVRGYDSLQIGEVMMSQGLAMFLSAPLAGRLSRYLSPPRMLALGLLLLSLGAWQNSRLTADWGLAQFLLPQLLRGVGLLFCMFPLFNIALGTLRADEIKNASGLYNVMRNIGGAIGLALINTLINTRSWLHWQMLSESVRDDRAPVRAGVAGLQALARAGAGGDGSGGGAALLMRQMQQQVAVMTFGDLYMMLAIMIAASLLLLPLIERPRQPLPAAAVH